MSSELVTAIITTHRRPLKVLKRAIESVLCQTYPQIELNIVNDDPNYEGNTEILEYIQSLNNTRVHYFLNDKTPGACASRNIGIANAKGSYIALLDDDDAWCETKIAEMLPMFTQDVGLVFCDYNNIKDGQVIKRKKLQVFVENAFEHLLLGNFIGGCSVPIINKKCFDVVGMFDENLPSCQDIDMWLRIAKQYEIAYLNKELVYYYISDTSITSNYERRVKGWNILLEKYADAFEKHASAKKMWQKNIITVLFTYGNVKEAMHYYNAAFSGWKRISNIRLILEGAIKRFLYIHYGRRT